MAKRRILEIGDIPDLHVVLEEWLKKATSDRDFAIVGGTFVENCLEAYLKSRMADLKLRHGRSVFSNLFDGTGSLSTFSAKNNLAYAVKLVGPTMFKDMEAIRDIRNMFAHNVFENEASVRRSVLSFDSQEVKVTISTLSKTLANAEIVSSGETTASSNRERFSRAATIIGTTLWLVTRDSKINILPEDVRSVIKRIMAM